MRNSARHPIPIRRGHLGKAAEQLKQATGTGVEIISGTLVISPTPCGKHAGVVIDLRDAMRPGLAPVYEAYENVSVAMADDPDDYTTPDLTVGPLTFMEAEGWLLEPRDVVLAVEVLSPNDRQRGTSEKLAWYAAAGVARLLQIDPRTGTWSLFTGPGGVEYKNVVHGKYGEDVPLPEDLGGELPTSDLTLYAANPGK
ncbi:Uma2 family endonuclease [Streptomyces sp. TRM64462]|uniref:Uma2 family endonuclease n=1 Tax=Streptomyces sp. TRM64462 TaxID=2741726 RepID=UPI001586A36B|nr:Uma2 family endonuclease [Streptomyces sp. TRM64462]